MQRVGVSARGALKRAGKAETARSIIPETHFEALTVSCEGALRPPTRAREELPGALEDINN
ncbi:MAG: hypothetical protein C4321_11130 [Chloroflexota bacterium]